MDQILKNTQVSGNTFLEALASLQDEQVKLIDLRELKTLTSDRIIERDLQWFRVIMERNSTAINTGMPSFQIRQLIIEVDGYLWSLQTPLSFYHDDHTTVEDSWGRLNYQFTPFGYSTNYLNQLLVEIRGEIDSLYDQLPQ